MSVSEEGHTTWKEPRSSTMNQEDGSEVPPRQASAGLWMWGASGGRESKHRVTAAGAYVHYRAPGTAPIKYHIKAKVGFLVQGNLTINSKSLWSKTKKELIKSFLS